MQVLVLVLDGFPARHLALGGPGLGALAQDGGWAADGGRAVMTSSAAPNLATFATGATPNRHGIPAALVPVGRATVRAEDKGPAVPTIFEAVARAGRSSAVVVGERRVAGVLGAPGADVVAPPEVRGGDCVDRAAAVDDAVTAALELLLESWSPDVVVGHLSLPGRAAEVHGPDGDAAAASYRATGDRVGRICAAAAAHWRDAVVVVLSDHDQQPVDPHRPPVDLEAHVAVRSLPLTVVSEGGAALLLGPDRQQGRWLSDVAGVAGTIGLAEDVRLVWARPGRVLARGDLALPRSVHGGPATTTQLAVVGGGHPAAACIARSLHRRAPNAADWAVTVADLLELPLPTATGRSLLAG